jgi:hypothetical protein
MTKVKNYWDKIKDKETHYSGGEYGWEVHLKMNTYRVWDHKTNKEKIVSKLEYQWPYWAETPRAERALCRKEVLEKRKQHKILAQASRDGEEFYDLQNRVGGINSDIWNEVKELNIKGFDLGKYIRERYLTDDQAYTLFYRM